MRVKLIINPNAGIYTKAKLTPAWIRENFAGSGHRMSVKETAKPGDGEVIARYAAEKGYDMVIAVGGDGTLNDVAKGLIGTETAMGVIPMGSGNGFARHFKIPLFLPWACQALWDPKFKKIDVGELNGKIFLVTCGLGLDADISFSMDRGQVRGMLAYIWHAVVRLIVYRAPEVLMAWNGEMIRTAPLLMTVCNLSQYGGGFRVAPGAKSDDGKLDLCWIPPLGTLASLWNVPRFFGGSAAQVPGYQRRLVEKVRLIRDHPGPAHIDGDPIWADAELDIRVIPGALKIALPRDSFKRVVFPNPILPDSITKSIRDLSQQLRSFTSRNEAIHQQRKDHK
jgi:diacylglycerol kinase (ATP)